MFDHGVLIHALVADAPALHGLAGRIQRQVGIYGTGAVADQHGEVVHLACLAAFHQQAGVHAQFLADQMVVHRAHCKRRRDDGALGPGFAVADDQDARADAHRALGVLAQPVHGLLQPALAVCDVECRVQDHGLKGAVVQALNGLQFLIAQDRAVEPHQVRDLLGLVEQVAARAEQHAQ